MELVLWRHADAENADGRPDAERSLTSRGKQQAEDVAAWLRPKMGGQWRILVSPAKRALETVAALGLPYEECEEVGLAATARTLLDAADWPDGYRVLIVGHQPTLGEVASHLLGHDVEVRKGAVLWLETSSERTELQVLREP